MEKLKTIITLAFFAFLMFFLPRLQSNICSAKIFNAENSMVQNPQDVPNALEQYTVGPEIKGFFKQTAAKWEKFNEWGISFWTKYLEPFLGKWVDRVEQNIRSGLAEEKQEYKQDLFKVIAKIWERIKNFIFSVIK